MAGYQKKPWKSIMNVLKNADDDKIMLAAVSAACTQSYGHHGTWGLWISTKDRSKNLDRSRESKNLDRSRESKNLDRSREPKNLDRSREPKNLDRSREPKIVHFENCPENWLKNVDWSEIGHAPSYEFSGGFTGKQHMGPAVAAAVHCKHKFHGG